MTQQTPRTDNGGRRKGRGPGAAFDATGDTAPKHSGFENLAFRELRLLEEVHETPEVSQRSLALKLGVALGVANTLLRSLVRKGYIRSTQVGWKRWVYVVTPSGLRRKVNLTIDYVEGFIGHYQRVRVILQRDLDYLSGDNCLTVAVYGTDQLAELVYLALHDMGITRIEFLDADPARKYFLGKPLRSVSEASAIGYFRVIVASTGESGARASLLMAHGVDGSRIVTVLGSNGRDSAGQE
jgi:hypothetical protein